MCMYVYYALFVNCNVFFHSLTLVLCILHIMNIVLKIKLTICNFTPLSMVYIYHVLMYNTNYFSSLMKPLAQEKRKKTRPWTWNIFTMSQLTVYFHTLSCKPDRGLFSQFYTIYNVFSNLLQYLSLNFIINI